MAKILTDTLGPHDKRFLARTQRSRRMHDSARVHLAGGVSAGQKFMRPYPIYLASGKEARVTDIDGNEYIDLVAGNGSLILGHCPEPIHAAVRHQLERGTALIFPTELEVELARRIKTHMPFVDELRFAVTGSEATIIAVRAARAYTGRDRVAKFEGHFHGHVHDTLLVSGMIGVEGDETAPIARADSAGIPQHALENVLVLPFNRTDTVVDLIKKHADELAAVILEPLPVGVNSVPPEDEFLERLRGVTEQYGIILIFDEVVTGFRLGLGGAASYFNVVPDLVTLGKIIGGGFPIGAIGGSEEIMEKTLAPRSEGITWNAPEVFASGTFSGHPVVMAAGLATLDELEREGVYGQLRRHGERLRTGLREACAAAGVEAQVTGIESFWHIAFGPHEVKTRRDVLQTDSARTAEFVASLLSRSVLCRPAGGGFLTTAHSKEDIEEIVDASAEVLIQMAK